MQIITNRWAKCNDKSVETVTSGLDPLGAVWKRNGSQMNSMELHAVSHSVTVEERKVSGVKFYMSLFSVSLASSMYNINGSWCCRWGGKGKAGDEAGEEYEGGLRNVLTYAHRQEKSGRTDTEMVMKFLTCHSGKIQYIDNSLYWQAFSEITGGHKEWWQRVEGKLAMST